jgi:hypothetical protein
LARFGLYALKAVKLAMHCPRPAGARQDILVLEDAAADRANFLSAYSRVQNSQGDRSSAQLPDSSL